MLTTPHLLMELKYSRFYHTLFVSDDLWSWHHASLWRLHSVRIVVSSFLPPFGNSRRFQTSDVIRSVTSLPPFCYHSVGRVASSLPPPFGNIVPIYGSIWLRYIEGWSRLLILIARLSSRFSHTVVVSDDVCPLLPASLWRIYYVSRVYSSLLPLFCKSRLFTL